MGKKEVVFTVDLEDWYHALEDEYYKTELSAAFKEIVPYLILLLEDHGIKAIFYVLGWIAYKDESQIRLISDEGHIIGSHGTLHKKGEKIGDFSDRRCRDLLDYIVNKETLYYRSPYWDTTPMPWPPAGGFFFRFMPYWYVKWAVKKSGVFWIHPHDLYENHPKLKNPWLNWKRHVGLKNARRKLERLLSDQDIRWATL